MLRYALTIALSAFLLFQVQPLIAKFILPWFGGTPGVWTTCMLFFQVVLLLGYSYAHLIDRWLTPRAQARGHSVVLLLALLLLPIVPSEGWKPVGDEWPTGRILLLLIATIGLPYLLVSTTGPLMQAWFRRTHPGQSPYRLFALSNAGSLLALLTYPFLVEPWFTLGTQAFAWSTGFALFVGLALWCGWQLDRSSSAVVRPLESDVKGEDLALDSTAAPQRGDLLMWMGLSMFPSILLLATTSQVSMEVAVVPFLWILPLSLYLLSFIISFDSPRWYYRPVFVPLLLLSVLLAGICLARGIDLQVWIQLIGFNAALFFCCMGCHGELARSKPDPQYLTTFYLLISLGGALGGVFVVLIAPLLFTDYFELPIGLAACLGLTLVAILRDRRFRQNLPTRWITLPEWFVLIAGSIVLLYLATVETNPHVIEKTRGFYGTLTVVKGQADEMGPFLRLRNGRIKHGSQYLDPRYQLLRTSYYAEDSGVGLAILRHPRVLEDKNQRLNIAVIGLGTGSLAAYGQPGDQIRFYEINPDVVRIARDPFRYLSETPAEATVVLGDARIQMERELQEGQAQDFDVLIVDAFSSDAIPMHLLTREAIGVYLARLKPDGILAIHISNRYLDLKPVVRGLAREYGFEHPLRIRYDAKGENARVFHDASEWVLLTRNQAFLDDAVIKTRESNWPDDLREIVWTDDYGSLWQVMRKIKFTQLGELFDITD